MMRYNLIIKGNPIEATEAALAKGIRLEGPRPHPRFNETQAYATVDPIKVVEWFCAGTNTGAQPTGALLFYRSF